jgi:hypothetical protein
MWIDWKGKVMKLNSSGKEVILTGIKDNIAQCPVVSDKGFRGLLKKNVISHWVEVHQEDQMSFMVSGGDDDTTPILVKELLGEFKELFAEPQSLPPRRAIDHQIPLIPGAQPVNVRP